MDISHNAKHRTCHISFKTVKKGSFVSEVHTFVSVDFIEWSLRIDFSDPQFNLLLGVLEFLQGDFVVAVGVASYKGDVVLEILAQRRQEKPEMRTVGG